MRTLLTLLIGLSLGVLSFVQPSRAAAPEPKEAGDNSIVAVFELQGPLLESPSQDPFLFAQQPASLRELAKRMRKAGDDANVKAVVLLIDGLMTGGGQAEELRQLVAHLREKGKDVYVHSDSMMLGQYVVAAGATRVSVAPTGIVLVNGLHGEALYLRGLLDKLGVKAEMLQIGRYKSAGELFTRDGPSKEADEMLNWLFDGWYDVIVQKIADGRKVEKDKVKKWMDKGLFSSEHAKEAGLVDAVEHRQEFDAMLKKEVGDSLVYERKYGVEKDPQLDFSNPFAVFKIFGEMFGGKKPAEPSEPGVGIVYVDGMILPGSSKPSLFGAGGAAYSSDIRKALDEAARDDSIKAVVLRIDSPGGSAVASEIILDATKRVKAKKPFVVSMGNIAGSGGYYVACGADTIYADAATLTGSIGVVAGKFMTNDMWKKIGVTFKSYDRGENANLFASDTLWSDEQRQLLQDYMNEVYGTFTGHVTDARGDRLKKPLEQIAGGRVYTGQQALELGLVDKIGSLQDAIEHVAKQAKLEGDYAVRVVPRPKNFIEQLVEETSNGGSPEDRRWIATGPSLVELAAPMLRDLDPARVAAIRAALQRLQLLGQEGVILAMPEALVLP